MGDISLYIEYLRFLHARKRWKKHPTLYHAAIRPLPRPPKHAAYFSEYGRYLGWRKIWKSQEALHETVRVLMGEDDDV